MNQNQFVRITLTLALPFVLVWVYVSELVHGIRDAFHYAWLDVKINLEDYHQRMERRR